MKTLSVAELALWREHGFPCELLDVRRASARAADGTEIAGSRWLDPAAWLDWKDGIAEGVPRERPVVVYCAFGHEISQGLSAALGAMGADARHLEGGIAAWKEAGRPVRGIAS